MTGSKPNSAGSQEEDVRFPLLSIMRQRTLPVQIDTSIMRILPKVSYDNNEIVHTSY